MKTWKWMTIVLTAAMLAAGGAWAENEQLVRFKTGDVAFTLLEADGVTPMAGAELKLLSPRDAAVQAEALTDRLGKAVLALSEGRYLLNVSGRTLSVLDVSDEAVMSTCRVVIPDAALMVAGQEAADKGGVLTAPWLKPVVIGGVVVLVAAGGYAIYEHNEDDDKKDQPIPPPAPPAPFVPDRPSPSLL